MLKQHTLPPHAISINGATIKSSVKLPALLGNACFAEVVDKTRSVGTCADPAKSLAKAKQVVQQTEDALEQLEAQAASDEAVAAALTGGTPKVHNAYVAAATDCYAGAKALRTADPEADLSFLDDLADDHTAAAKARRESVATARSKVAKSQTLLAEAGIAILARKDTDLADLGSITLPDDYTLPTLDADESAAVKDKLLSEINRSDSIYTDPYTGRQLRTLPHPDGGNKVYDPSDLLRFRIEQFVEDKVRRSAEAYLADKDRAVMLRKGERKRRQRQALQSEAASVWGNA